jgi:hypothetical protein
MNGAVMADVTSHTRGQLNPVEVAGCDDSLTLETPAALDVLDGAQLVEIEDAPPPSAHEAALQEETETVARTRETEDDAITRSMNAISTLTLAPANLERGVRARTDFEAGDDGEVGERLLEELVANEVPIALQLQDVEGALATLLSRSITLPEVSLQALKVLRETVHVSNAVRRRIENSLGAAANLRAQRRFLATHRGRSGI